MIGTLELYFTHYASLDIEPSPVEFYLQPTITSSLSECTPKYEPVMLSGTEASYPITISSTTSPIKSTSTEELRWDHSTALHGDDVGIEHTF